MAACRLTMEWKLPRRMRWRVSAEKRRLYRIQPGAGQQTSCKDPRRWTNCRGDAAYEDPAPELFRSGRQFAAWIGLTPKDHSTAGKVRLAVITRAGDEGLRSVLTVGATAVIKHALRDGSASPWLIKLLARKPPKLAAVALANNSGIAWKLMATSRSYATNTKPAATVGAV